MSKIFHEIINSDFKSAKKIIDDGFDINTQDSLGRSLLFYTKLNMSKYLLKKGIELVDILSALKDRVLRSMLIKKYRHVNIYKNMFRFHEEKVLKKIIENQNLTTTKKRI